MDLVTPGFGLVFWTTLTFIFLLIILKKYAWKPILKAVNDREEGIRETLDSLEKAKKEIEFLNSQNERVLKEARLERDKLLKDAREIKEKMILQAKEEAQAQAKVIMDNAIVSIEIEKKAAIAELKTQVANLSIEIAKKVVKKELSSEKEQLILVDKILKDTSLN